MRASALNETDVIGNGTDVVSWDNGLVDNYWSDYNGQGAYVIDENNIDRHPLSQQVDISSASTIIAIVVIVTVVVVVFTGLIFYLEKRNHQAENVFSLSKQLILSN